MKPLLRWFPWFVIALPAFSFGLALSLFRFLPEGARTAISFLLGVEEQALSPIAPALGFGFIYAAGGIGLGLLTFRLIEWLARVVDERLRFLELMRSMGRGDSGVTERVKKLEDALTAEIKEAEARLRSEWRFVAAVIISVLLASFLALLVSRGGRI